MRVYKRLNILFTVVIFVALAVFGIFVFRVSYFRAFEAIIDLYGSFCYYFGSLFGNKTMNFPSVTNPSDVMQNATTLPSDYNGFVDKTGRFFELFFNKENFVYWCGITAVNLANFLKIATLLLPIIIVLWIVVKRIYEASNNRYNEDTKPLKAFKFVVNKTYLPIKRFVLNYVDFVKQHRWIWVTWIVVLSLHFNLASILIEFFAYYFFFAISFEVGTIYTQFVKLVVDLQVIFTTLPWWVFVIIAWFIFCYWRKKIAQSLLRRYEARNCGFINELPIVSMTCGSMGKKKTTVITDMTLSQEVMFRQKALEILQKTDMKFPNLPWICFEKELEKCLEFGTVHNLATAKEWVKLKRKRYEKHGNNLWQLYGYDSQRCGLTYNDGLKTIDLFDALTTYAQAYLIYVIQSSLIVSNYSTRTDNVLTTEGNFPMWVLDFFSDNERESKHAHILDFDVLRLGKKLIENNPNAGSFEFGVIAITEIGKERGNMLDHKETKKNTSETNQKNDLFNSWLKMCRHSATVDNYPFIKVFTDEQRPESWVQMPEIFATLFILCQPEIKG